MKDDVYTPEWFLSHNEYKNDYRAVADVIAQFGDQPERRCIDVGCGLGLILERLSELGWSITGVDGSKHSADLAPPSVRNHVFRFDLTTQDIFEAGIHQTVFHEGSPHRPFPLVLCTEVAEHLPESAADNLVDILTRLAEHDVFFTAATPNQGGLDHINEQPHEYWIKKFADRGFRESSMIGAMRGQLAHAAPKMPWFGKNAFLFVRKRT